MDDKSTTQPGPMGWGTDEFSDDQRLAREQMAYAQLQQSVDERMLTKQPAKAVVNTALMDKIKALQEADGIEDGFSFLHLEKAIFGEIIPWKAQIIGSCVASGGMYADVGRELVECFLVQEPEQLFGNNYMGPDNFAPFAPFNYRAGRYFGGLNGNRDGSFCAEHIRGKLEYGYLLCQTVHAELSYQENWYPEPQSSSVYKEWGANNQRLDQFKDKVDFRLEESVKIRSAQEMADSILDFKPAQICSSWGFGPQSNISGWTWEGQPVVAYRRSGTWAHNMTVYGYVKVRGEWYFIIRNSWGFNAHKNGCWFAVPASVFDSWARQAEIANIGNMDLPDAFFGNPFSLGA